jgi:hypothetical protein
MRFSAILFLLVYAGMVSGETLISEPHALVYYQLPFSGNASDTHGTFGLRMDRTIRESGQNLDYRELMIRPAAMDFRFSEGQVTALSVGGVDYLARYRALRADEEQKPAEGTTEKTGETAKPEEEKLTMGKILDNAPMGYIIGAGIGVLLIGTSAAD